MSRKHHLFSLIASLLLIFSLALVACSDEEATPTPPAEVEEAPPPEAATPTPAEETQPETEATATTAITDTEAMTETSEITSTAEITDTSELTETAEVTGTLDVTDTTEITSTAEITDTSELTETAEVTGTTEITSTAEITDTSTDAQPDTSFEVQEATGILVRGTDLLGANVKNQAGENLGTIEDLIIELDSGNVAYIVMGFGGFLGIGEDLFAIPLNAFELDVSGPEGYEADLILNITEEQLQEAPRLEGDWPDTTNPDWDAEIRDFWGVEMQEG